MKVLLLLVCVAAALSQPLNITSDELDQFELFKIQHARDYTTTEEEEKRKAIFVNHLRFVKEHNEKYKNGEKTFTVAINKFADLTVEEFAAKMNGYVRSNLPRKGTPYTMRDVEVPKTKDWRTLGAVTAVKDQGSCGGCWAFSTTGSVEGQHFLSTNTLTSLSEQDLIDCSTAEGNEGCNGGIMDYGFDYIMANDGIDTEAAYPYKGIDSTCKFSKKKIGATITNYIDIDSESEEQLLNAVANVGPISVAIDASLESFQLYESGVYDESSCSTYDLDHGVLVVGYGKQTKGGAYWLVKNSWGTDWGMSGYIMMSRNKDNQCGIATEASYPYI